LVDFLCFRLKTNLFIPEAIHQVVIHYACGLHGRIEGRDNERFTASVSFYPNQSDANEVIRVFLKKLFEKKTIILEYAYYEWLPG
jgi:hypothetical protein